MSSPEDASIGYRLDQHHAPETNGRMSVCRRCGGLTDGPVGLHHLPHVSQVNRSEDWLTAQARIREIDRAKDLRARQRRIV
ncbi:MAG TPA: hypothetical protein VND70_10300 [Acidimicrobiales bacterium]|nr:hypothetical protein [Acidimicrobiales bacterium]